MPQEDPATRLFDGGDLTDWLDESVTSDRVAVVEQVVWGWLKPVLALTERPVPVPDEVFSWAIELGAIAHVNPNGLSSYQLGEERQAFSSERRDEILATAAAGGRPVSGGAPVPVASFPEPDVWPAGLWA